MREENNSQRQCVSADRVAAAEVVALALYRTLHAWLSPVVPFVDEAVILVLEDEVAHVHGLDESALVILRQSLRGAQPLLLAWPQRSLQLRESTITSTFQFVPRSS